MPHKTPRPCYRVENEDFPAYIINVDHFGSQMINNMEYLRKNLSPNFSTCNILFADFVLVFDIYFTNHNSALCLWFRLKLYGLKYPMNDAWSPEANIKAIQSNQIEYSEASWCLFFSMWSHLKWQESNEFWIHGIFAILLQKLC